MKGYVKNVDMEIVKMDYFQMGIVHVMLVGLQMEHQNVHLVILGFMIMVLVVALVIFTFLLSPFFFFLFRSPFFLFSFFTYKFNKIQQNSTKYLICFFFLFFLKKIACDPSCKTCSQNANHCLSCHGSFLLQGSSCGSTCGEGKYPDESGCQGPFLFLFLFLFFFFFFWNLLNSIIFESF